MRLPRLQPLGFLFAFFLVGAGTLQHGLIFVFLGAEPKRIEQLKLGLGYDLMHGALLAGLLLFLAAPWGSRSKAVGRWPSLVMAGFFFLLFADYVYVTQFGTHLPFSSTEYLGQAGEFSSTIGAALSEIGFWLLFVLPLLVWFGALYGLRRIKPQWFRLKRAGVDLLFWLVLAAVAGARSNSMVDKNLNDPLTSNGWIYFYWSKSFTHPQPISRPDQALAVVAGQLSGELPEGEDWKDYPLARKQSAQGCRGGGPLASALCGKTKPNVLFILLESFRAADLSNFNSPLNLTPRFSQLSKEGVLFRNFYANGFQIRNGEVASFCSMVPNYGPAAMREYVNNRYRCLPALLKEAGYKTSIMFGTNSVFDNQDKLLPKMGFSEVLDASIFDKEVQRLGWGVSDKAVFNRWLDHLSHQEPPFFSAMLTITNHHPFEVPEGFRFYDAIDDQHRYFESMRYTDQMLYEFIQKAKTQSWWGDTLIFVFADTSNYQPTQIEPKDFETVVKVNSQIPLLILGGALKGNFEVNQFHDQLDLAPTVMDLLRRPYVAPFAGQSLLSLSEGIAMTNRPGSYWAVMSQKGGVFMERDQDLTQTENTPADLAEHFKEIGLSWNQAQSWILQENRLWPPEAP
ncbi:MAG: hypothetical protein A2527_13180 [Candidatus Lambdaproteobacteria bacterium RIFOXYD2_FULL_50_16]|uniref:Sulfatase N-terminal domain-containing protein n=1 Tax=Candidatus Lambdaproteobacteria bacterium RIFOXYD2_FULL_50_16 TaxID=1817772 RepID=A0A1F6GG59_9PROT|nr:MAG: hypothetical protein A2527_13180 [Candidatus Lambdaproteobacteria bacterium RIFOXYD2_FULL_50_16]